MAVNNNVLADADGDYSDWIEIHNPTASAVNLDGWYLTDDAANLTKWRFPAVTLASSGYLVVFASDKNRTNASAQLHTNFKLSSSGEYLALVQPDGVTVVSEYAPTFPPQAANISYGMTPETTSPTTLVQTNSAAQVRVPAGTVTDDWKTPGFAPDGNWSVLTMPVGYETGTNITGANILFVVATNSTGLTAGDAAVLNRLTNVLRHSVTIVNDTASKTSDATNKHLVIVSSTVTSGNVNTKFLTWRCR